MPMEETTRIGLFLLQLLPLNVRMMMRREIRMVMMIKIMTAVHVMKMMISTDSRGSLFALVWLSVCVCARAMLLVNLVTRPRY